MVGINSGAAFLVDTNPINESCGGDGNGIIVFTNDKQADRVRIWFNGF